MTHIYDSFDFGYLDTDNWTVDNPLGSSTPVGYTVTGGNLVTTINDNTDSMRLMYTGNHLNKFKSLTLLLAMSHYYWTGDPDELFDVNIFVTDSLSGFSSVPSHPSPASQYVYLQITYGLVSSIVMEKAIFIVAGPSHDTGASLNSPVGSLDAFRRIFYDEGSNSFLYQCSSNKVSWSTLLTVSNATAAFNVNAEQHLAMEIGGVFFDWSYSTKGFFLLGEVDMFDGTGSRTYYTPSISGQHKGQETRFF